ncbi:MAG: sugar ABC transporter permease, partial [Chloroflexota bacterium]
MALPAIFLLFLFLILPFLGAFAMSFTNQRLVSPNPTEFVGTSNFTDLLSLRFFTLEPERDATTGEVLRDEDGNIKYPRLRNFTRNNPDYPQLDGMQEWRSWQSGENRTVLLASDVLFWTALTNTFIFVVVVAPLQGGLALLLALLI